jgi:hydrogenase maturation factor
MSAFRNQSGKIDCSLFNKVVYPKRGKRRAHVIKGPKFGVDTSVVKLNNGSGLAVSSDPLSLIPPLGLKESAWLSVHLLANDMATTGFSPQFAQFVLNLPTGFSLDNFKEYWHHIHTFCEDIGVAITVGHTAQTPGQESTTPGGGTMFLQAPLDQIITRDGADPGDKIIITKEGALAASAILAKTFPKTVQNRCGQEAYRQGCDNFYRTTVLADVQAATDVLKPNTELKAMHDVTEGGLLGGIFEMAAASGCGCHIYDDNLPVHNASKQICDLFEIDHRCCVGAGSMVMAVQNGTEQKLINHLQKKDIPAVVSGEFTLKQEECFLIENGKRQELSFAGEDPYWEAFFNAQEAGWK